MSNPRPAPSRAVRLVPLGAFLLLTVACQSEVFGGKDTYADPIVTKDYAQEKIDAGPRKGDVYGPNQRNPCDDAAAAFADAVLALDPKPASVACLPLVSQDLKAGKPWVSELGVATADAVARTLREKGFAGQVYATEDVGLALNRANLSRGSMTTIDAIAGNGERLGADVVVFGTFRRRDQVGALDRDVIACELTAYDVAGRRIATSTRWEMVSDDASLRRVWEMAQRESPWMPDSRWGLPSVSPDLATELQRVVDDLTVALGRTIDPAAVQGSIYVAPLDVTAFAPHVAALRSAQAAYAAELAKRYDAATAANAPVDLSGTIVLAGTEYPTFQAAEAYLTELGESFQSTGAARFARTFSTGFADTIRSRARAAGKTVNDLSAVKPSERPIVEGELAQGGIPRSTPAHQALQAAGVGLVVASRLEKVGDALQIRVDAYDPTTRAIVGDARAPISGSFLAELERAMSASLLPGGAPRAPTPNTWSSLYGSVKSGVVHVQGSQGRGSGFVVRDGLVLTNDHVARGIGEPITVTPEGGTPLAARVVANDAYWDLAAIQVEGLPASCHVFTFADAVDVGTQVAVLGHPRDSSGWVLTPGYVSSISEQVSTEDGRMRGALMYTSPTRQGSSGSPVLLDDGRVVAVHCAGRAGQSLTDSGDQTELTGFALGVPAREARQFAEKIARP